jgi:hypothetical protein
MSRWRTSHAALAGASVLLGVLVSAAVNLLTSGNSKPPIIAGAAIAVISLVALETWRARRSSQESVSPPDSDSSQDDGKAPRALVRGRADAYEVRGGRLTAVDVDRANGTIEGSTRVDRVVAGEVTAVRVNRLGN